MSKLKKFAIVMLAIAGILLVGGSFVTKAEGENTRPRVWVVGIALAFGVAGGTALMVEYDRQEKREEAKRKAEGRPSRTN
jgi:hypothetical protein